MKISKIILLAAFALTLSSCHTSKRITYFQDVEAGRTEMAIAAPTEIKIQAKDKLSILVSSQDPRLSSLFNLPIVTQQIGTGSEAGSGSGSSRGVSGYTVNSNGDIDFPVLGALHIEGMTREEVASYIKQELQSHDLLKEPVVTVEFQNLIIDIMGEVGSPGRYYIDKDHVTLLDALSQAGDLTIDGRRDNVKILRSEGETQRTYEVDLRSAEQIYASPAYYLQQNDVVYVEPSYKKARQSTVNGTNALTPSFWFSAITMVITLVALLK